MSGSNAGRASERDICSTTRSLARLGAPCAKEGERPVHSNDRYFVASDGPDTETCQSCKRLTMREATAEVAALRAENARLISANETLVARIEDLSEGYAPEDIPPAWRLVNGSGITVHIRRQPGLAVSMCPLSLQQIGGGRQSQEEPILKGADVCKRCVKHVEIERGKQPATA